MKTIVLMPVYRAEQLWDYTASSFYQMDPQPDKWIFCENNSPDDTIHKLAQFKRPHELIRFWVRRDANLYMDTPYDLIAIARQFLLQRARQLDPDWAVFIDSDIEVISPNLLDLLTSHEGHDFDINGHEVDIIGAPYLRYSDEGLWLACTWRLPYGPMIGKHSLKLKAPMRMWDTWLASVGGGCMALSRRILQDRRLNFYPVRRPELGFETAEDLGYCLDARRLGYVIGLDASVKLGHSNIIRLLQVAIHADRSWCVDASSGKPLIFEYPA